MSRDMTRHLKVHVAGHLTPTTNYFNVLGGLFKSSVQATDICNKIKRRNQVDKALAGSSWCIGKKTFFTFYKAIARSVFSYATRMLPRELRHSASSWHLPVRQHNPMLSLQYLLRCYRRSHPNYDMMDKTSPPKRARKILHATKRASRSRSPLGRSEYDIVKMSSSDSTVPSLAVKGSRPRVVLVQLGMNWWRYAKHPPSVRYSPAAPLQLPGQTCLELRVRTRLPERNTQHALLLQQPAENLPQEISAILETKMYRLNWVSWEIGPWLKYLIRQQWPAKTSIKIFFFFGLAVVRICA